MRGTVAYGTAIRVRKLAIIFIASGTVNVCSGNGTTLVNFPKSRFFTCSSFNSLICE